MLYKKGDSLKIVRIGSSTPSYTKGSIYTGVVVYAGDDKLMIGFKDPSLCSYNATVYNNNRPHANWRVEQDEHPFINYKTDKVTIGVDVMKEYGKALEIKTVIQLNGQDIDNVSDADLITCIKTENKSKLELEAVHLMVSSTAIQGMIATHKSNLDSLASVLDMRYADKDK
jgi:hypothetical protein